MITAARLPLQNEPAKASFTSKNPRADLVLGPIVVNWAGPAIEVV